uniref:Uncharacterized protein n=1 Tax=Panagrellus redivivus TaxID=6233 RepID=A0A7E4W9K9_PANRE
MPFIINAISSSQVDCSSQEVCVIDGSYAAVHRAKIQLYILLSCCIICVVLIIGTIIATRFLLFDRFAKMWHRIPKTNEIKTVRIDGYSINNCATA